MILIGPHMCVPPDFSPVFRLYYCFDLISIVLYCVLAGWTGLNEVPDLSDLSGSENQFTSRMTADLPEDEGATGGPPFTPVYSMPFPPLLLSILKSRATCITDNQI